MDREEVFNLFDHINMWKRGGERAPHKPLLILFALGKCSRGEDRWISFSEVNENLKELLVEFGPPRGSIHPEYPFWRLQNDGVWELSEGADRLRRRQNQTDALKSELIKHKVCGSFPVKLFDALIKDQRLLAEVAENILEKNFPPSIHEDILHAVGLDIWQKTTRRKRDPSFQHRILVAYEYKCAICGYDVRLNNVSIGLEAAHIKWHQAGGPDTEDNGLALCVLHHKILDRGAITLDEDYKILVSQLVNGSRGLQDLLLCFHNQRIRMPQSFAFYPNRRYISWHQEQVFRGPHRTD